MKGQMYSFRVTSPTVIALINRLPHKSRFIRDAVTDRLLGEAADVARAPAGQGTFVSKTAAQTSGCRRRHAHAPATNAMPPGSGPILPPIAANVRSAPKRLRLSAPACFVHPRRPTSCAAHDTHPEFFCSETSWPKATDRKTGCRLNSSFACRCTMAMRH